MILETAVLCMALNIYMEARSEMIPGQYAVANVTMNRAGTRDRVCKVVTAKDQFSWTRTMLVKQGGKFALKPMYAPKDEHAWELAQRIAAYTIKHRPSDLTFGATHYHATYVDPKWRTSMEQTKRMGRHIFYKMASKSQMTGNA